MTLQQLIVVLEAYRCGSISKAAQNLFMSQPNLSKAIRALESEIHCQIFNRTKTGIECTEEGKEFLAYASDIVTSLENLQNIYQPASNYVHTLSVVTARSSEACFSMTEYINSLVDGDIPFRIKFMENTNYDVINNVLCGEADVGILRANTMDKDYYLTLAESKGLTVIDLSVDPYVLLLAEDHPLAKYESITNEMLEPYTELVYGDYEHPMYPFSNYKYTRHNKNNTNKNVIFVYDRYTMTNMLTSVKGAYVYTSTTHRNVKGTANLVERKNASADIEGIDAIVINPGHIIKPEMKVFINLLLEKNGKPKMYN